MSGAARGKGNDNSPLDGVWLVGGFGLLAGRTAQASDRRFGLERAMAWAGMGLVRGERVRMRGLGFRQESRPGWLMGLGPVRVKG